MKRGMRGPKGFRIRPIDGSDEDYQAGIDVWNAVFPDEIKSVTTRRHSDETRQKQYLFQRIIGEIDGTPVMSGYYGESEWSPVPGKYILGIQVLPEHQRRGCGGASYDYIWNAIKDRDPAPVYLMANAREDVEDGVRFLTKRGFRMVQRQRVFALDVESFDSAPFRETLRRVDESEVEVRSLAELMEEDPDALRKVYEAGWEFLQDVPMPDPLTKMPFEQYLSHVRGPTGYPESWFVAVDAGRYVGMSQLWKEPGDPARLYTGLTGVARTHRRRGIATALKIHAIEGVKGTGVESIHTDNEENNPMYLLNMRLGFRPRPGWLVYKNELGSESPAADQAREES